MLQVGFQGAHGAYSELALRACFAKTTVESLPLHGFRDVFEAVATKQCDFGMVPLENALTGSIHENFDNLLLFPSLSIGAEYRLRIRHSLITLPNATAQDIKEVLSHPQGLAQCADWLARFPQWKPVSFYDTAGSVEHIAQTGDKSLAAIASSYAAQTYGMSVFAEGIETNAQNYTRFGLLQRTATRFEQIGINGEHCPIKASLVFGLADRPGSLLAVLEQFAVHQLNMTKIESRPIHGKPFEYNFYVDLVATDQQAVIDTLLISLLPMVTSIRLLGIFPVFSDAIGH